MRGDTRDTHLFIGLCKHRIANSQKMKKKNVRHVSHYCIFRPSRAIISAGRLYSSVSLFQNKTVLRVSHITVD